MKIEGIEIIYRNKLDIKKGLQMLKLYIVGDSYAINNTHVPCHIPCELYNIYPIEPGSRYCLGLAFVNKNIFNFQWNVITTFPLIFILSYNDMYY